MDVTNAENQYKKYHYFLARLYVYNLSNLIIPIDSVNHTKFLLLGNYRRINHHLFDFAATWYKGRFGLKNNISKMLA